MVDTDWKAAPGAPSHTAEVGRARALARVLDSAVGIPGTRLRVGLDSLVGLIPGAGDVVGAAMSGYIVLAAVRLGAPKAVIYRMMGNVLVDTVIGAIPLLGDLFDVAFKANMRNVALLERFEAQPAAVTRQSRWVGALAILVIALVAVALGAVSLLLARALWQALTP